MLHPALLDALSKPVWGTESRAKRPVPGSSGTLRTQQVRGTPLGKQAELGMGGVEDPQLENPEGAGLPCCPPQVPIITPGPRNVTSRPGLQGAVLGAGHVAAGTSSLGDRTVPDGHHASPLPPGNYYLQSKLSGWRWVFLSHGGVGSRGSAAQKSAIKPAVKTLWS